MKYSVPDDRDPITMKHPEPNTSLRSRMFAWMKNIVMALLMNLCAIQVSIAETVQKTTPRLKLTESKSGTPGVMEFVLSLVLVLLAILLMAWLLKRFGGYSAASSGAVKVLTGISLGGREKAVLVEVGGQQILLGVAPGRVQTLHVLETPVEVSRTSGRDHSFAEKLRGMMNKDRQK